MREVNNVGYQCACGYGVYGKIITHEGKSRRGGEGDRNTAKREENKIRGNSCMTTENHCTLENRHLRQNSQVAHKEETEYVYMGMRVRKVSSNRVK